MMRLSLGNKLTWYLLLGVLIVTGLDLFFSLKRTRQNLLDDVRREVTAIGRTLQVTLAVAGDDDPERYFVKLAPGLSSFENVLGVVFYSRLGQIVALSDPVQGRQLPQVDVLTVMATRMPVEGFFQEGVEERYYRVEPILSSHGEGMAAFLILEDFPFFNREVRGRMFQTLQTLLTLLVVLALIVSVVIRHSVTQPLRAVTQRIKEIGQGHFQPRLQLRRRDEIGELAAEFDQMSTQLEAARRSLMTENEEKLRLERALRHSEKLAALGHLASRLAHEIGTPLNVIQMRAEQLLQRETQSERDRAFLNVIVAQIERISRFIRQLLTLARRPDPQLRLVSLNDISQRTWDVVGDRAGDRRVEMTLALAERLPRVWGDADQLQQVLLNLTVNAMHAVGEGGRVRVRTRVVSDDQEAHPLSVEVSVADNGPGIPSEDLSRIFDPFFTTKDAVGGTGLGLAISREIVARHQGEIHVETTPETGSCFIVTFPVATHEIAQGVKRKDRQEEQHDGDTSLSDTLSSSSGR
jgi:signal transduction histidine kinase